MFEKNPNVVNVKYSVDSNSNQLKEQAPVVNHVNTNSAQIVATEDIIPSLSQTTELKLDEKKSDNLSGIVIAPTSNILQKEISNNSLNSAEQNKINLNTNNPQNNANLNVPTNMNPIYNPNIANQNVNMTISPTNMLINQRQPFFSGVAPNMNPQMYGKMFMNQPQMYNNQMPGFNKNPQLQVPGQVQGMLNK